MGGECFVNDIQARLDIRARDRQIDEDAGGFVLRETGASYATTSDHEKRPLSSGTTFLWRPNGS
jgi:hypothetical protein